NTGAGPLKVTSLESAITPVALVSGPIQAAPAQVPWRSWKPPATVRTQMFWRVVMATMRAWLRIARISRAPPLAAAAGKYVHAVGSAIVAIAPRTEMQTRSSEIEKPVLPNLLGRFVVRVMATGERATPLPRGPSGSSTGKCAKWLRKADCRSPHHVTWASAPASAVLTVCQGPDGGVI